MAANSCFGEGVGMAGREVLFEFRRIGAYVKVSAIDALTGIEICIVGDAAASEARLKQTALKKLEYVLAKNNTVQR